MEHPISCECVFSGGMNPHMFVIFVAEIAQNLPSKQYCNIDTMWGPPVMFVGLDSPQ